MEHVTEKRKSILDNVIETLRDAGVFNEGVHRNIYYPIFESSICFLYWRILMCLKHFNQGQTRTFNPVLHKALELGLSLKDIDFLFTVYDEFLLADSISQLFDVIP